MCGVRCWLRVGSVLLVCWCYYCVGLVVFRMLGVLVGLYWLI